MYGGLRSVMLCRPPLQQPAAIPSLGGWQGWNAVIQELRGGVQQGLTHGHWTGDRRTLGGAFSTPPSVGWARPSVGHRTRKSCQG